MYKYKYTGGKGGIMTFYVDDTDYTVANNHRTLPEIIDLPKKVNIGDLELVEDMKRKKIKEDKGVD